MAVPLEVEIVAPTWVIYERKLAKFPHRYKEAIRRANIKATRLHQRSLRAVTPVRTGRLRRGWVVLRNTPSEGVLINRVPYAVFIEFGTRPHMIYPKRAKFLRFKPKGSHKYVFAKKVSHPGTRPYRMIQNAWRLDARRVRDIYRKEFAQEVGRL